MEVTWGGCPDPGLHARKRQLRADTQEPVWSKSGQGQLDIKREPNSSSAQHAKLGPLCPSKSKHGPSQWVPLTAVGFPRALQIHVGASANCQRHPWLGQAAAVPLKKLQKGIYIPLLPRAHLPIPKGTVLLCKCDGKATTGSCHGDSQRNIFCQSQGPTRMQKVLVFSLKCAVLRTITHWSR